MKSFIGVSLLAASTAMIAGLPDVKTGQRAVAQREHAGMAVGRDDYMRRRRGRRQVAGAEHAGRRRGRPRRRSRRPRPRPGCAGASLALALGRGDRSSGCPVHAAAVHRRGLGALVEGIAARGGLGEGDDVADRPLAGQLHDQAIRRSTRPRRCLWRRPPVPARAAGTRNRSCACSASSPITERPAPEDRCD